MTSGMQASRGENCKGLFAVNFHESVIQRLQAES